MNVVLMASGAGTNAINLIHYSKKLQNVKIVGIIVDKKSSGLLKSELGVPVYLIDKKKSMGQLEHEELIILKIKELQGHFVLLCGYMRVLSLGFLKYFYDHGLGQNRVLNIHPSLLPKYKGAHAYQEAYSSGDPFSGVTIHFVDEGMDTGKIFEQMTFARDLNDSFEDFVLKGKNLEWQIYPKVLDWLEQL